MNVLSSSTRTKMLLLSFTSINRSMPADTAPWVTVQGKEGHASVVQLVQPAKQVQKAHKQRL
jgi:hypothetical protein